MFEYVDLIGISRIEDDKNIYIYNDLNFPYRHTQIIIRFAFL